MTGQIVDEGFTKVSRKRAALPGLPERTGHFPKPLVVLYTILIIREWQENILCSCADPSPAVSRVSVEVLEECRYVLEILGEV